MKRIKRFIIKLLSKFIPLLKLYDEVNVISKKLSYLYNTDTEKFYQICNLLGIRHFFVANLNVVNLYIDDGHMRYKITLAEPNGEGYENA